MPSEALKRRIVARIERTKEAIVDEQTQSQRYTRCLACNDTGLVDPGLVLRYIPSLFDVEGGFGDGLVRAMPAGGGEVPIGEIDGEVITLSPADPGLLGHHGFACNRIGCGAKYIEVSTESGSKRVERYSRDAVRQLAPDDCQYIHETEVEKWRQATRSAAPVRAPQAPALEIGGFVVEVVPGVEVAAPAVDPAAVHAAIGQLTDGIKAVPDDPKPNPNPNPPRPVLLEQEAA